MTRENKDEEVIEAAPQPKPKLALVVILSILTGVLLTWAVGATVYHFQSGKALQAELAVAKEEAKRKTLMIDELQEQIAGLSKQIHALRDFSVAKASGVAGEAIAAAGKQQPPAEASPSTTPAGTTATKETPSPPVAKKPKPAGLDCQLVGKSAEEQMATLQRCTKAMDGKK